MPTQIKGTAIQAYRDWLKATVPPGQYEAILKQLAGPTRKAILENVLPSSHLPYSTYGVILEASKAVLGTEYERLAFEHGRLAAQDLLAGVYRLTLKPGDVERTLKSLAVGWRTFFDTGEILVTEKKPGRQVFVIADPTYHPLHPPISAGYVQHACEMAGAKTARVAILGSPPRVEMVITWS
jgi:hypothetical protein